MKSFIIQVDVRELTVSHIDTITSSLGSQLRLQLATQVNRKHNIPQKWIWTTRFSEIVANTYCTEFVHTPACFSFWWQLLVLRFHTLTKRCILKLTVFKSSFNDFNSLGCAAFYSAYRLRHIFRLASSVFLSVIQLVYRFLLSPSHPLVVNLS